MDCTVDTRELKAALAIANRAVGKRGYLPALSGVRLSATDGQLSLVATNLDCTVTQTIAAEVRDPGLALVPAKLLAEQVKSGKGPVALTLDGDKVSVVNGITTQLRALPLEEFLRVPELSAGMHSFAHPLDLADIAEVIAAASKDGARPILAAVLFAGNEVVATDSYRLHVVRGSVNYPKVLVPVSTLAQVLAAKPKGSVTMQVVTEGVHETVLITAGSTTWSSRVVEGEFPNFHQLIPSGYANQATMDRLGFISLVAHIGPMAKDATPVRLSFDGSTVTVSAVTHDVGESKGSMACTYEGEPMTVAFNPAFLLDTAKVGRGDNLTIGLVDALKPAIISDDRGTAASTRLLMPVRVS